MRARIGAHALHAAGKTNTEPARKKFRDRFELEVDPDGTLAPVERVRRAEHARKRYFTQLAFKSALARKRKQ